MLLPSRALDTTFNGDDISIVDFTAVTASSYVNSAALLADGRSVGVGGLTGTSRIMMVAGAATFRFGARPAAGQQPGAYLAGITFEVIAPDA